MIGQKIRPDKLYERAKAGELTELDAQYIFSARGAELMELSSLATALRQEFCGNQVHLCTISNAKSGLCSEDCKFCAQSVHYHTSIPVYPLKPVEDLLAEAHRAESLGSEHFGIVTSGRGINNQLEIDAIEEAIRYIKNSLKIKVCASLGMVSEKALSQLKEAGLSRYHHNIETAPSYYPKVVSTHSASDRINMVKIAREMGLEVCSGGIIGLGESWRERWEMAKTLKDLEVKSVPLNALVPISGTPSANTKPISARELIQTFVLFRLMMPNCTLKYAAGREGRLKDFQGLAFMAGANGMLIGGYLTVAGRSPEEDKIFKDEVEDIWSG